MLLFRQFRRCRVTGGVEMYCVKILAALALCVGLAACSSPQDDAARAQERSYDAQEKVAKERLKLIDQYRSCMKDAGGDDAEMAACNTYVKAAEALK